MENLEPEEICFACGVPGGELKRGRHISDGAVIYAHVKSCQKQLESIIADREKTIAALREALEAQEKYDAHFDSCHKCDPGAIALPCGAQDLSLTAYKLRKQALARKEDTLNANKNIW